MNISQAVSYLLHPVLVTLICMCAILFRGSAIYIPIEYKLYIIAIVMLSTAIVPALMLPLLKAMGVVKGYALLSARERVVPLVLSTMGYCFCAAKLSGLGYFPLADIFFISFALLSVIEAIISYFWKVSLHSAAAAHVATFIYLQALYVDPAMYEWLALFILLWGVVSTARLKLGRHNIWQIAVGTMLGVLAVFAVVVCY